MLRKTLNKIFTSRVFYMLFSLLVASALWMYVQLYEVQERPHTVENVPIVFLNIERLGDRGFLISSYMPETMTFTFDCTNSVAARLTSDTLSVEVDLVSIRSTGAMPLKYDIIYPEDIDKGQISSVTPSVERITLLVDRLTRVPVPVNVDYRGGTASDDLIADAVIFDPQTIVVSGPEEVVSRIKSASVPIPRESLSTTYTGDLEFILHDENGDELDEKLLTLVTPNPETIHVIVPIRVMKDIPLDIALMHGSGTTDNNTKVTCEPSFIQVAGDPDAIRDLNSITLGTIDTTRYRDKSITEAFRIIVPNYITNLSGETEASVLVEFLGLDIDYNSTLNLHVINTPIDYKPEIRSQSLDVWIRGRREDLDLVSSSNIRVVADLTDAKPGTARFPARVFVDGIEADVGAVGEYRITVTVIREQS